MRSLRAAGSLALVLSVLAGCSDGRSTATSGAEVDDPSQDQLEHDARPVDPYVSTLEQEHEFVTFEDWRSADLVAVLAVESVKQIPARSLGEKRNNAAFQQVTASVDRVISGPGDVRRVIFYQLGDDVVDGVKLSGEVPGSIRLVRGDMFLAAVVSDAGDYMDPARTGLMTASSLFLTDGDEVLATSRRARRSDAAPGASSKTVIDDVEGRPLDEVIDRYLAAVSSSP